jgi:hypothetical protein
VRLEWLGALEQLHLTPVLWDNQLMVMVMGARTALATSHHMAKDGASWEAGSFFTWRTDRKGKQRVK